MKKALFIPYTFTLMNWAAVAGFYHFLRNTTANEIWTRGRVHAFPGFGR